MKSLKYNNYKLKDTTRDSLKANGWHYCPKSSNAEEHYYSYQFPAYKIDKNTTALECTLIVTQETGRIDIEVNTILGSPYAPFYSDKYSHPNSVLIKVNSNIKNKMRKLGIVKKNENVYRKLRKRM